MADNPLIFNFFIELIASAFIFCHRLPRRSHSTLRIAGSIITYALFWILIDQVLKISDIPLGLEYIMMLFALMGLAFFCFSITLYQAFFCAIISYASQHCFFRIAVICTYYGSILYSIPSLLSYWIVFFLYFTGMSLIARKWLRTTEVVHIKTSNMINICSLVIISEIVLVRRFLDLSFWHMDYALYVACSVYQALASGLIVALLINMANQGSLIKEMELMDVLHDRERKQMELSKEYSELISIKAHDLKSSLANPSKVLTAEDYDEIHSLLSAYSGRYHTENETFNLILNETGMRCDKANIDFHCMADVHLLDGIRPSDLYFLLGNSLENAVEAASSCAGDRYIRMKLSAVVNMLSIHIENTYSGELKYENGRLCTSKADSTSHGFGIRSMEWIIKCYSGTMNLSHKDGIFCLDIILPLPVTRKCDNI